MTKGIAMVAVCATLTCAGTALATTTPQQKCDYRRIIAWKKYQSCVYIAIARAANGTALSDFAPHAYCRHAYFLKWTAFQSPKQSQYLAGSTCVGDRFADNGNQTVTDNLTGLVWEKKDNLDSAPNSSDPHDADNAYTWNNAVSNFPEGLNTTMFAGRIDWRLPTMAELQTIVLDFRCSGQGRGPHCECPASPCVDPVLGPTNTEYWAATVFVYEGYYHGYHWTVEFGGGGPGFFNTDPSYVRAVRGGIDH